MSADDQDQTFLLRPAPPVRGLAISAVAMLVGAVVLVASSAFGWPAPFSWLGLMIMIAGAAVGLAAWISSRRLRSVVILRRTGITVSGVRGRHTLAWSGIGEVTSLDGHLLLRPSDADAKEVIVVNPRGVRDPSFATLAVAIKSRLDTDRGYREY